MKLPMLMSAALLALAALSPAAHAVKNPEVTMYVMPQCGYCEKMRHHLEGVGVAWTERDISEPAIKAEFDAKGGIGTPLVVVGDEVIKGFMPQAVDASLRRQGLALKAD